MSLFNKKCIVTNRFEIMASKNKVTEKGVVHVNQL